MNLPIKLDAKKKKLIRYPVLFGVCLLVLLLGAWYIMGLVTGVIKRQTAVDLEKITAQTVIIVRQKIETDQRELDSLASAIGALGGVSNEAAIDLMLEEASRGDGVRLIVSDGAGNARSSDGGRVNINGNAIFQQALAGTQAVYSPGESMVKPSGQPVITLTAPITNGAAIVGAMISECDINSYEELVRFTLGEGQGNGYIVTTSGEVVIWDQQTHSPHFVPVDEHNAKSEETEKMWQDIQLGKSGMILYEQEQADVSYLAYQPLEINDWYLINRIGLDVIEGQNQVVKLGIGLVTLLCALLLGVLMIVLFFVDRRHENLTQQVRLYNGLTGLPNMRYMQEYFGKLSLKAGWVYLLIRIPEFERMGTSFGYPAAARLLKNVAAELRESIHEREIAAHLTEDCFALLLQGDGSNATINTRVERLFSRLEGIPLSDGTIVYEFFCIFRAGLCAVDSELTEITGLNRRANEALETLQGNKSEIAWFNVEMEKKISLQESLMHELARALEQDEFVPFFHPHYNPKTGEIVSAELLARWQHPEHGILMPGIFVPLLEAAGCALELDLVMLEQACKMIHRWLEEGLYPVALSVNLSKLNIYRKDFFQRVVSVVRSYDIPTNLISLELDEKAITTDLAEVISLADRFHAEGLGLTMDGFEGRHTSLIGLQDIPVDTLILSRHLWLGLQEGERANTVLRQLVSLARALGLLVVAQGVETKEQESAVLAAGCNVVQGFYYHRPMSTEDFERLIFASEGQS